MFAKKFRVRVAHYYKGDYVVQYAHYRFIPIWHSLKYWFDQGHPGGTEGWMINLWNVSGAEQMAKRLKSIEDVNNYYVHSEALQKAWKKREEEYWKRSVPYTSKEIR